MNKIKMYLILIMLVIIVILIWWEYTDHDCIPGKNCQHSVPAPTPKDPSPVFIDKLLEMVRNNYSYVTWRQALLAGLIAAVPIVYFLKKRMPTLFEWIVVAGFVFVVTYYSYSWIWAHFYYPNSRQIEKNLVLLRDRIIDAKGKPKTQKET